MQNEYNRIIQERADRVFEVMAKRVSSEDMLRIRAAFELAREAHAPQKRKTGEPYILHPIAVANIAAEELMLGANPVIACFLHDVVEDTDYTIDYQNAGFDDNMAIQIGQAFSAEDAAMMVGIATPSATACYAAAEDKDIPVIFTAITDPVGAKLDSGNITGTSDAIPVEKIFALAKELTPEAQSFGLIYNTSEDNSLSVIAQVKGYLEGAGLSYTLK